MAETPYKSIVDNIRNWPFSRKLALAGMTLLCMLLFGLLIFQARKAEYRPMYTELPRQEAASVTAWLKEQGVPYKLENNGRSIYVPAGMVYETRLNLAGAGLPKQGGVGFEIFDKQNFGVTKFTQKVNFQRAMQGELARTISALEPVKSSRVHLVLPEDRLLQEQQEPAKASVVVDLAVGSGLNGGQTQSIIHLVAGSIEGLDKARITVIDTKGRVLSESKGRESGMAMLPDKLKFKNTLESRLEDRVQSLLDKALGRGNSVVRVTAELDFTREEVTSEEYDPDSLVPRSEKITESTSGRRQSGGVPGTESNLGEARQTGDSTASTKSSEVINYEISKTVKQVERPVGEVENISAAVLVADKFKPGGSGEKGTYVPLSDEKLTSIRKMVVSAIGLDNSRGDRVEVVSMPFEKEVLNAGPSTTEPGIYDYLPYIKYLIVLVCALLVYLFLLRPVIKTLRGETGSYQQDSWPELAYESEEGSKSMDSPARLRKEIENSSVTPAQVVRTWLKEG
ncbi:MAG: flagellar M-ring protein FliF [Desulfobacteraceae bacterium]|nr:flagellar M-ring protein FliF [Desulfobacteraceae bacterium]MCF8094274.1 flagellar M-ring protein FliF [Desulfobacteraceae bacterium]